MPNQPTKWTYPNWFHVADCDVLNGRAGPSTSAKIKYRRPRGYNLYLRKYVWANGRGWLVSRTGTYYATEFLNLGKYVAPPKPKPSKPASPVPGHAKGYAYGVKDSRYIAGFHTGQDWPASTGSKIVAVVGGTVIRTDWGGAYGNWTLIRGGGHTWVYCHQQKRAVKRGQKVKAGQTIGYVGTTGNVTGPHLHMEKSRGSNWAYGSVTRPTW